MVKRWRKLGAGGVLTDPNDDRRTWFWAHFYADGEGVLTASPTPDPMREVVASNRICAIGKYVGLGLAPWDGVTGATHLLVHEPHEREWPGQSLGRALDALHVQLLRLHDDRLPWVRPVDAHGPVLHVLGVQQAHDHPGRCELGSSYERYHGLAVLLLVLDFAGRW